MDFEGITTKRCIIREITLDDIDALFALYDKPNMTKYIEPLYARDEEIAYRRSYISDIYRTFGFGIWGVFYRENGEMIGCCGFEYREGFTWDTADLGYMIAPEYQRKGICMEVLTAVISYAKEHTALSFLQARIRDDNLPSIGVAKKLGMERTDRFVEDERVYILNLEES